MAGSDVVAPIRVSQFETRSRYTIDTKPQFLLSKIIGNEVQMGLVVRNGQKVMFWVPKKEYWGSGNVSQDGSHTRARYIGQKCWKPSPICAHTQECKMYLCMQFADTNRELAEKFKKPARFGKIWSVKVQRPMNEQLSGFGSREKVGLKFRKQLLLFPCYPLPQHPMIMFLWV